jgi:gamma-glutamyltranspeptidase/glutathione hydrolase
VRRTALGAAAFLALALGLSAQNSQPRGAREPAWAPDGRRLAFSYLDRIWLSAPDGKGGKPLRPETTDIERDPSWSTDGRSIVFAADNGQGFNLVVVPSGGGDPRLLTTLEGDERWPSWTSDGRIVFSHRAAGRWQLHVVDAAGGTPKPLFSDTAGDEEQQGRVSPDGKRVAYLSDRDSDDGDRDLWVAELAPGPRDRVTRSRLVRVRGAEGFPAWSPDSSRLAFFAVREGAGGVWVVGVPEVLTAPGPPTSQGEAGPVARPASAAPPTLVSRHGGAPAWSPDGKRLAIANLPLPDSSYNGNPERNTDEPPPLFAGADAFRLWLVDAPLPIDSGEREILTPTPRDSQLLIAFDRVWETLRRLYYSTGPTSSRWVELKAQYRPKAQAAQDEAALESAIDAMVAEQPLIKPLVVSDRAVVVSGSPLASRAGALALERGGNIVDAAIAVSFALGVVEPDASGIGGDGMAVLYLKGMAEPVAIDYKDQVPIHATRDNPLLTAGTGDGPAAANIPGVVAGLDLLYRNYASKRIPWSELIAPALDYAENGYELDTALPTSIAEGRKFFEKYRASARIYLPNGKVPKAGDRFVNKDYAATLRAIAKDGADAFYRGSIAKRIADDMAKNGGLITVDDLAQYRAIERRPLAGRYRDHQIYSVPPPVSTGAAVIETLQILENYQLRPGATYARDADYLHYVIESWRARDQAPRIADPALFDVNLGSHLDRAHAATLFKRIDPKKASRDRPVPPTDAPAERIGRGTTAFAVADADGNMIAVTQTLSTWGGTFYVSDGLGFLYNNHLRFGGGAPGRFLPLARSSSTSVPTLVFKAHGASAALGSPRLAVGAAGNNWIPASVYDIILNVIDGGMDAQRAIEAPRFLVVRDPADPAASRVQIEDRIPRSILVDLTARGHRFQKIGRKGEVRYGYAAAAVVDVDRRQVQGGAEPRRSHAAVGVTPVATAQAPAASPPPRLRRASPSERQP